MIGFASTKAHNERILSCYCTKLIHLDFFKDCIIQILFSVFAEMANWVKSKSSWSSMFDFKTKEPGKRNGDLHQNFTNDGDHDVSGKHNGNRIAVAKRSNQVQTNFGKSQIYVRDKRSDHASSEIPSYNGNSQEIERNSISDGDIVNGNGREISSDEIIQGAGPGYQQVSTDNNHHNQNHCSIFVNNIK